MPKYKRTQQIIKPRLQWKLMLLFAGLAACAVMVQSTAMAATMSYLSAQLPHDGALLLGKVRFLLIINLLGTLAIVLPVHLLIGRMATFRIAGPLYRFEKHLAEVAAGERPGPCRIRKDDELHDFCEALNRTLRPLSDPLPVDTTEPDQLLDEQPSLLGAESEQEATVREEAALERETGV